MKRKAGLVRSADGDGAQLQVTALELYRTGEARGGG